MNFQAEAESSFDPIAGFVALTGREPFRWQRRLLEEYLAKGHTPDAVDVPTGLGKTMVMALWLIARAQGSPLLAAPARLCRRPARGGRSSDGRGGKATRGA
jgi:CRISPR/Cas system-associated endonuclease/helicase Cas3